MEVVENIIDTKTIREYLSTAFGLPPDKVDKIVEAAVTSLQDNLRVSETSCRKHDYDTLFRAAHTLKGALGNLNLPELSDAALEIEKKAREKNSKFDYAGAIKKLETALAPLISGKG